MTSGAGKGRKAEPKNLSEISLINIRARWKPESLALLNPASRRRFHRQGLGDDSRLPTKVVTLNGVALLETAPTHSRVFGCRGLPTIHGLVLAPSDAERFDCSRQAATVMRALQPGVRSNLKLMRQVNHVGCLPGA
jgi:hypothetical protein